jgi:predicted dehydrogenase
MLRVGIIGLGFMGKMHFRCWNALDEAKVVAICDIDPTRFVSSAGTAGNIAGAEQALNFEGVQFFTDAAEMLASVALDVVSITLPTDLHAVYTQMVLQAGVHALCEKPMALNLAECASMIAAANQSAKQLQIGHCIRFWPAYAKTKELVDSQEYGKVLAATFQRLSLTPDWSWNNWLMDGQRSGGAILDMHIHDSDFVQYLFGLPQSVFCRGIKQVSGAYDHVMTSYLYPDGKVVSAEGGWVMTPGFGFQMSFNLVLEHATIVFDSTRSPAFKICPQNGPAFTPPLEDGDGYSVEIRHFADLLLGKTVPAVLTPSQSADSLRLIMAEVQSADIGLPVML